GIRVPLIVRWPGVVKPGTTCAEPVISVDFLPTFAEFAGAKLDASRTIDGVSFAPLLRSSGRETLKRDALFWHFPGYLEADTRAGTWRTTPAGAVHSGDFKLIEFFEDNHVELYNLKDDLGESKDLADKNPEKAKELREKLHAWRKAINAPMPKPNPEYVPPAKDGSTPR